MRNIPPRLADALESRETLAVALSGGVDSAVLLMAAREILGGQRVLALTARAPYTADSELAAARETAGISGAVHRIVDLPFPPELRDNPPERCLLCKRRLMGRLAEEARQEGFGILADGSNADDTPEYRPGMRALEELSVISPLREAGLDKDRIRLLAAEWGLPSADRPSNTCLLTRFPAGGKVAGDDLRRVEEAESHIRTRGYPIVRVRDFGGTACIEVAPGQVGRLADHDRTEISAALKALGYRRVAIDLEGYRFGSMEFRKETANG